MNIHQLIFWLLYVVWLGMEFIVIMHARRLRKKQSGSSIKADKGSIWFIVIGMYILIAVAFFLSVQGLGLMPGWVPYLGNVIMAFGIFMRYGAITQLGRFFSTTVQVASDQTVIHSGWYRLVRHPAYTGGWLIAVGLGVGLDTWIGTLIIAVGLFAIYAYRISVEEQALVAHLGTAYRDYRRHTRRMFPGAW